MYIIMQDGEELFRTEDLTEAMEGAKDSQESGSVQIFQLVVELEHKPVTDWDRYNGVRRGVDYPATLGRGYR